MAGNGLEYPVGAASNLGSARMAWIAWIDTFTQATVIMCLGMAMVFLFVSSLVVLIQLSARIFSKYIEEAPTATPSSGNQGALVAAIAAAMHQSSSGKK